MNEINGGMIADLILKRLESISTRNRRLARPLERELGRVMKQERQATQ